MRTALIVALVLLAAASGVAQQFSSTAAVGRSVLIVVDDLHVNFADTPRTRTLLKRVIHSAIRPGDRIRIISTGPSAVAERTLDATGADAAINRFVGMALQPAEALAAMRSIEGRTQLRQRAVATLIAGIHLIETADASLPTIVVYVSNGHLSLADFASDPRARTDDPGQRLDELIRAANIAGVPIYTLSPREVVGSTVQAPDSDEWRRYTEQSRETLRSLASQTAGVAAIDPAGLENAIERLRDFAGR
jgi:hypothetical protein